MSEIFSYNKPDKYEEYCGITNVDRKWWYDGNGDFYYALRNYKVRQLDPIYTKGYRDPKFRKETIQETFERIATLPIDKSENRKRFSWFNANINFQRGKVLDIGSGFGVWPHLLKVAGWDVECVEPNEDSARFINNELHIPCRNEFFSPDMDRTYDVVSIVHVLEHISTPRQFIRKVVKCLKPEGKLFVEVPDAVEFRYLPRDHDEFNSCHVWFFTASYLCRLFDKLDLDVTHLHRPYYKDRKLSRIQVICERNKR